MAENRGGYRPTAPQNNPANISGTGGNGQSGDYTGFAYGENKALNDSRVAGNKAVSSMRPVGESTAPNLPPTVPVTAETQLKDQSVMHGAPIGGGANSIPGLPQPISDDPDLQAMRDVYPILQVWASQPGSSQGTKDYVRYLGTIIQ
jgi:hypothetical protein